MPIEPIRDCLVVKGFWLGAAKKVEFVLECDGKHEKCRRNCRCIRLGKVCLKLSIERLA